MATAQASGCRVGAQISIDGHTDISFTENVQARYDALGWHTQHVADGNVDMDGIRKAVEEAKKVTDKPSFIRVCPQSMCLDLESGWVVCSV